MLDSLRDNAYGIYLIHYAFVSWLQLSPGSSAVRAGQESRGDPGRAGAELGSDPHPEAPSLCGARDLGSGTAAALASAAASPAKFQRAPDRLALVSTRRSPASDPYTVQPAELSFREATKA